MTPSKADGKVAEAPRCSGYFLPKVDTSRCTGCGWCVAACPLHLLSLERTGWKKSAIVHDSVACTGCKKCEFKCLFKVITVHLAVAPMPANKKSHPKEVNFLGAKPIVHLPNALAQLVQQTG